MKKNKKRHYRGEQTSVNHVVNQIPKQEISGSRKDSETMRESQKSESNVDTREGQKWEEDVFSVWEQEKEETIWEGDRVFSVYDYEEAPPSLIEIEESPFLKEEIDKKMCSPSIEEEKEELFESLECDVEIEIPPTERAVLETEETLEQDMLKEKLELELKKQILEEQNFNKEDSNIAQDKKGTVMTRNAEIKRETKETNIELSLNLDGSGKADVSTGIGFLDHMLKSFARHGFFDLKVKIEGDLFVDCHHTIEDTGIVLGEAIKKAIGEKVGIKRYGSIILPMDDALILCAVDLSGRPYLSYEMSFSMERVGYFDTEMVREFFYAISYTAGINLHIKEISGFNNHHKIEACFKAFARALDEATRIEERLSGVLSTKGTLS